VDFILLDSYEAEPAVTREVLELNNGGRQVTAII
jgi:hypothetical protein